jgi:signal transduction histidine kinase
VEIIVDEVSRLERFLEQLQSLSHTPGQEKEKCDVNRIIEEVLTLVKGELKVGKIELQTNLADILPHVSVSEDEIKQVLLNLIQNAVESMLNGGYLRIDSLHGERGVMIKVKDTGTGIPSDILENIFQSFFTTKTDGSGLGLHLSNQIIKAHGGSIKVEQSGPEDGTTFIICLPVG